MKIDLTHKRIIVTGGAGFLGRCIVKELESRGCRNVYVPRSNDWDLREEKHVGRLMCNWGPQILIHAAAHAGGIGLNQAKPAELFYDNLMMGMLLMSYAKTWNVEKFVQIGTICSYPKHTPVPFKEIDLWNGYPDETNAPYGIAKKALMVMGQAYRKQYGLNVIHLLPVNMYGPNDNFDPQTSHVIPALIRKFIEAKNANAPEVTLWGDGSASREFLYVEDCAQAIVGAAEWYNEGSPINIGVGSEITIKELANTISSMVGYEGQIVFDTSKPNGQPRRCLDTSRAFQEFGFKATTSLKDGLKKTIDWYKGEQK